MPKGGAVVNSLSPQHARESGSKQNTSLNDASPSRPESDLSQQMADVINRRLSLQALQAASIPVSAPPPHPTQSKSSSSSCPQTGESLPDCLSTTPERHTSAADGDRLPTPAAALAVAQPQSPVGSSQSSSAVQIPPALRHGAVDAIRHALENVDALDDDIRSRLLGLLVDLRTPVSPRGALVAVSERPVRGSECADSGMTAHCLVQALPRPTALKAHPVSSEYNQRPWNPEEAMHSNGAHTGKYVARQRSQGSLSQARDHFKARIRAPERSHEFNSSLLRELEVMRGFQHASSAAPLNAW